jgi:hypothetical protein
VNRTLRAVAVAVALGALGYFVIISFARPFVGGDTPFVLDGTNAFLDCLSHHDYNACGYTGTLNFWGLMSPIGWWPLLQHVPDMISIGLGGDGHAARTKVLAYLSVVGVIVTVALGWLVLRRYGRGTWFWAFLFVALSGPILAFARQTAGEMLAMGLIMGLVAATLLQAPAVVVGIAALLACWTKETSYPFIAALGVLGLVLARRRTGRPIRAQLIAGAVGIAVAIVTASLFNIVRFGSVLNTNYLDSHLRTPGLVRKLELALAVFFSPSGGLLYFWPAAVLLIATACIAGFRRDPLPALVIAAATVVLAIGFGSWWTPFGWSGYGPRLQLPWVLPLLLIALVAYGEALEEPMHRLLRSPLRALLVFAVVLACAFPHIGYMWKFQSLDGYFLQENPPCNAPWRSPDWYPCQDRLLWRDRPMPLYTVKAITSTGAAVTAVIIGLGLAGCLVLLRADLVVRPLRRERTPARPEARTAGPQTAPAR